MINFAAQLSSANGNYSIPDDFTQRQSQEEMKYLKYHKCRDTGEAYGASYFITRKYLLESGIEKYNLTWVNCEMGSFTFMNQRLNANSIKKENITGTVIQSLDVLDFSVIHLSAYERLQRRWKSRLIRNKKKSYRMEESVENILGNSTKFLKQSVELRANTVDESLSELNRTVAIMPFAGSANGAGHSVLSNRYLYLSACVWSIYAYIPNIVVAVQSQQDYDYCKSKSGLPLYDVIYANDLPKVASLPVATSQKVRQRLLDGRYDFDYVFFTESDQILLLRKPKAIFNVLKMYPKYVFIPHRLMPYPMTIVKKKIQRAPIHTDDNYFGWFDKSCCMDRQNCFDMERKQWRPVQDSNVSLVHAAGFAVPLGNTNFLKEKYHHCTMMPKYVDICP